MTNTNKLLQKFIENPKGLKYHDIELLLIKNGYKADWCKGGSSHKKVTNLSNNYSYTVAIHQKGDCLPIYKVNLKKFYLSNLK